MKRQGREKRGKTDRFPIQEECIWMKAGVVNFRLCNNTYDCFTCPFDRGMRRALGVKGHAKQSKFTIHWSKELKKQYNGPYRPCRHILTGKVQGPKICTLNYECYHCPFDQMLDDLDMVELPSKPHIVFASGFKLAEGYYYHLGHSWVKIEHGGLARVGFDDFQAKVFGKAHSLKIPDLGTKLRQGHGGWAFTRDDHAASVLSPISGTVVAVNHKVREHPEIPHEDPYYEGWLFIVEPTLLKANLKGLYFGNESLRWLENENQRLLGLLGREHQSMASTGGEMLDDLFGLFPELGWERLVKTFLRT